MELEHEWTKEETDEHRLALTKDVFCMAALLLGFVRASRLMEHCDMLLDDREVGRLDRRFLEIFWAVLAFTIISIVLTWHLFILPPAMEGEPRGRIIALVGHIGSASVQTVYLQWGYFGLNLLALVTADAQLMTMVYRMSVWVNMQGILLTVFFFKLHWYEPRCPPPFPSAGGI
jgi:hypothetical protein